MYVSDISWSFEICHTLLSAGTIISWVPRPNKNAPTNVYFDDDAWIECNGIVTCKSGRFRGQTCTDLSDRVLVGAGRLGQLLDVKDASLPDHAHSHTHRGTHKFTARYRTGPSSLGGRSTSSSSSDAARGHNHTDWVNADVTVDFSKMGVSEAFISRITNSKVSKSTEENELYSPHVRVTFMFKCL